MGGGNDGYARARYGGEAQERCKAEIPTPQSRELDGVPSDVVFCLLFWVGWLPVLKQ
jgi:hypothetical protein